MTAAITPPATHIRVPVDTSAFLDVITGGRKAEDIAWETREVATPVPATKLVPVAPVPEPETDLAILERVAENPLKSEVLDPRTLDALERLFETQPAVARGYERRLLRGTITKKQLDGARRLRHAERTGTADPEFPIPTLPGGIPVGTVERDPQGLRWVVSPTTGPLFSALAPIASLRVHEDERVEWGLRIALEAPDGSRVEHDCDNALFAGQSKSTVVGDLRALGLRATEAGEKMVFDVLKTAQPERTINIVRRAGLHRTGAISFFAGPAGDIVGPFEGELGAGTRSLFKGPQQRGTAEGWRDEFVARLVKINNVPHWRLGAILGGVGPLVAIAGRDSPLLNLNGTSSGGKTTSLRLAVSAWSSTGLGKGLCRAANTTSNAVESVAAAGSGTLLALDELAQITDVNELSRLVFALSGGQGKQRLRADTTLRRTNSWTTLVMFSLEKPVGQYVKDRGGRWVMGNDARLLDIRVDGLNRDVPRQEIAAIMNAADANCGTAGPAFVRWLYENGKFDEPDAINAMIAERAGRLASSTDGAKVRLAEIAGMIWAAGDLMVEAGLLPAEIEVERVARWAFNNANSGEVGSDELIGRTVDAILGNLTRMKGSEIEFKTEFETRKTIGSHVLGHYYDDELIVWIHETALGKLSNGETINVKTLLTELRRRGILKLNSEGKKVWRYAKGFGKGRFYAFDARAVGYHKGMIDAPPAEGDDADDE